MSNQAQGEIFLSVVIPCYNEQEKIEADLTAATAYLENRAYRSEIIVVDDGSVDDTRFLASAFAERHGGRVAVRVEGYERNRGKGYAVKTGTLAARGAFMLFADAGLCVPYRCVEDGLTCLRQGADLALGSRKLTASRIVVAQPAYRRAGSKVFGWLVRTFMGIPKVSDTQCGFKVFRAEAARALLGTLRTDGFMFEVETLVNAKRQGYRLAEFPVEWSSDADTRYRAFSGTIRNLLDLLQIRLRSIIPVGRRGRCGRCA